MFAPKFAVAAPRTALNSVTIKRCKNALKFVDVALMNARRWLKQRAFDNLLMKERGASSFLLYASMKHSDTEMHYRKLLVARCCQWQKLLQHNNNFWNAFSVIQSNSQQVGGDSVMTSQISHKQQVKQPHEEHKNEYGKFAAMISTSAVVMYLVSYFNVFDTNHIFFSHTRTYMAAIMGAAMAFVMLAFMRHMYTDAKRTAITIAISVGVFGAAVWLLQSQRIVDDEAYMEAMIPHHSTAILTSNRAQIKDPRVRDLADRIIKSQVEEIAEMKALLQDLKKR
jgi:hypothetical protein